MVVGDKRGRGVLASVLAVAISIAYGISATLTVGGVCYLLLIPTVLLLFESTHRKIVGIESRSPA